MQLEPIPGPLPARPAGPPVTAYAVMHALRALERLAHRPYSVPELASALGVSIRTARRLVYRLRDDGYLIRIPGHRPRYRPTLRLTVLGATTLTHHPLPAAATPHLDALARDTGSVASLWIAADGEPIRVLTRTAGAGTAARPDGDAGPVRAVLAADRRHHRSYAYARNDDTASAAAPILHHQTVIAALGLHGHPDESTVAHAARIARTITRAINAT